MFSFGDLLGSGMASDQGERFVDVAVKAIEKVQADVSALLALDTKPGNLERAYGNSRRTVDQDRDGADKLLRRLARQDNRPRRQEDILDEIADILDALSSEDALVAATAANGGGVFESQALGAGGARNAFNRLMWNAEATLGHDRQHALRHGGAEDVR